MAKKKAVKRKSKKKLVRKRKAIKPINLKRELEAGIKVELEHTKRIHSKKKARQVAERIAMDHLCETPSYYRKLKKCFPHEHNPSKKKWKATSGRVKLERFFWGHPKGTKGRISGGKLHLRGSPSAMLRKRDEGSLYSRRNPGAPGRSHMIAPFRMPQRNPVTITPEDMNRMNYFLAKMQKAADRAGRPPSITTDLSPQEQREYRGLSMKFELALNKMEPTRNPKGRRWTKWPVVDGRQVPSRCAKCGKVASHYHGGRWVCPKHGPSWARNPKTMKNYIVKEMMPDWKRKIDPRSIRTKTIYTKKGGKRLLRIGCPKGQWLARQQRCKVGTKAISMLTPKSEKILSLSRAMTRVKAGNPGRIHAGMIVQVAGTNKKGRVVMPSSAQGYWVLNMGGPHGTAKVVHESNIITRGKTTNPGLTIHQAKQRMPGGYVLLHDEAGEFIVKQRGAPESQWYFTDDLQDAVDTAMMMARRQSELSRSRLAKRVTNPPDERSRMASSPVLERRSTRSL